MTSSNTHIGTTAAQTVTATFHMTSAKAHIRTENSHIVAVTVKAVDVTTHTAAAVSSTACSHPFEPTKRAYENYEAIFERVLAPSYLHGLLNVFPQWPEWGEAIEILSEMKKYEHVKDFSMRDQMLPDNKFYETGDAM